MTPDMVFIWATWLGATVIVWNTIREAYYRVNAVKQLTQMRRLTIEPDTPREDHTPGKWEQQH